MEPYLSQPLLSVVIVGHNDEPEIVPLLNEIRQVLQGHVEYEIVYVDDGSGDGTYGTLRQVAQGLPILRVIRLAACVGPTAAYRAGIDAAGGTWIATLDGDGSYDPADIPSMFEMAMHYEGNAPLLVAGHRGGEWKGGLRHVRDALSNLVRRLLLAEAQGIDPGCNFRLCARALWLDLPWFDHLVYFMPALVTAGGGRVISVPINYRTRPRRAGRWGRIGPWAAVRDLLGVHWLQSRRSRAEVADSNLTDSHRSAR